MKREARLLLGLLAASVMLAGSAHAAPPSLFAAAGASPGEGPGLRHRLVHIDVSLLRSGSDVTLNLFEDLSAGSRTVRLDRHANGLESWSSRLDSDPLGYALFVERGDHVLGQIEADGVVFQVRPVGGSVHEIVEIDTASLPPEAEPLRVSEGSAAAAGIARAVSRDQVDSIRVLVVYTAAAAAASADIEAEAQLAVDAANTAYENSAMATRLELVATAQTDYVEAGDIHDDLYHLTAKLDGEMDEVHALRNAYLADFVALLTENSPDYCGLAALMSVVTPDFEDSAFSVTYRPCAVGNLTLAHEIGHNMGCHHDRANADSSPAYSWAYGFQDPEGDFRTVMAIATGCPAPCPRVAHFANPDVLYLGDATGIDAGQSNAAACALAIDSTSTVTCDFRTLEPPGMVEASTTYTDRVEVSFSHPWPWSFHVYRSENGGPILPLEITPASPFADTSAVPGTSYEYWVSTRSMVDGESSLSGPVSGMRAIAVCGNSIPELPAEDCDDGNTAEGDGCAPDCTFEVALDESASDCVLAINDRAARVAKTQGKENLWCVAAAAGGTQPDVETCMTGDAREKVAKARAKVASAEESLCPVAPDFGYSGSSAASDAAVNQSRAFLRDLFGGDVGAAVIAKSADSDGAGCQKALAKAADKVLATGLSVFVACKKERLGAGAVYAAASLDACFDTMTDEASSDGTRLSMAVEKLATTRLKKCAGIDVAAAFPGRCSAATGSAFDACVAASAWCRSCLFFDAADVLARDCDLFDNGAADASCEP